MELISRLLKRQIDNFFIVANWEGNSHLSPKATLPVYIRVLLRLFLHFLLAKIPQNGVKKIVQTHQWHLPSFLQFLLHPDRSETFQYWWDLIRDPSLKKTPLNEKVGRPLTSGFHFLDSSSQGRERHLPACCLAAVLLAAGAFLPLKIRTYETTRCFLLPQIHYLMATAGSEFKKLVLTWQLWAVTNMDNKRPLNPSTESSGRLGGNRDVGQHAFISLAAGIVEKRCEVFFSPVKPLSVL